LDALAVDKADYNRLSRTDCPPYLPVLLEAFGQINIRMNIEGTASYGAFTYSFVKNVRARRASSFRQAMKQTTVTLKTKLKYDQDPQLVGLNAVLSTRIPGRIGA
jgi:hypothetical protein